MEDDIQIEPIAVETNRVGQMKVLTTVSQAARFILESWPEDETPKLVAAKEALIAAYEGKLSPGAARIAFIEAAAEAGVWTMPSKRPAPDPNAPKFRWKSRKPLRRRPSP